MNDDTGNTETTTEPAASRPKRERKAKVDKAPKGKKAAAPKGKKAAAPKAKTGESKSVIDQSKYQYEVSDVQTASGRKSVSNGDRIAQALRGLDAKGVLNALKANGLKPNPAWDKLNPGMIRMNAGNMLRRLVRDGQSVKIEGKSVASL